jgi:Zn finger protein HypA/HybF involved in hydrogenase expression
MHDFHLANEIVKLVQKEARQNGLSKIKKINLELGQLIEHGESISPANLKYNINLLMPGVSVRVRPIPGKNWKLIDIEGEKN